MDGPNKEDRILGVAAWAIAAPDKDWAVTAVERAVAPRVIVVAKVWVVGAARGPRIVPVAVRAAWAADQAVAAELSRASIAAAVRRAAPAVAAAPAGEALAVEGAAAREVEAAEGAGDSVENVEGGEWSVEGRGTNIELKKVLGSSVQL